jgi:hypothetical protein
MADAPGPQPDAPEITSFDQDWYYVGSSFLTTDLRSNALGLCFTWILPKWTNTALFLPYKLFRRGKLKQAFFCIAPAIPMRKKLRPVKAFAGTSPCIVAKVVLSRQDFPHFFPAPQQPGW